MSDRGVVRGASPSPSPPPSSSMEREWVSETSRARGLGLGLSAAATEERRGRGRPGRVVDRILESCSVVGAGVDGGILSSLGVIWVCVVAAAAAAAMSVTDSAGSREGYPAAAVGGGRAPRDALEVRTGTMVVSPPSPAARDDDEDDDDDDDDDDTSSPRLFK